jgi:type IV pilus assembly protein PilA
MLTRIRKAMDEKEEGFTLIELLVVIIIIGILAAIAIPVFLNQRKKGWDAQAKSDIRNAVTAMETYLTDSSTGDYPVPGSPGLSLASAQLGGQGYKRSANASDVRIAVTGLTGTAQTYKLTAYSQSGSQFCFDSNGATTGITKVASVTTGTTATPPADAALC